MTTAFRRRANTGSRGAQKSVPTALSTTTADENLLHAVRTGTDPDQLRFDFLIRRAAGGASYLGVRTALGQILPKPTPSADGPTRFQSTLVGKGKNVPLADVFND